MEVASVPDYRLYSIDAEGSIDSVEAFSARDDDEAVRISRASARSRPAELWCRGRIVETMTVPTRRKGERP